MVASLPPARALDPPAERSDRAPRIEVALFEGAEELVVRLTGEAGVRQASDLEAALLRISARRPRLVTLDLSGLNFICCLAMGSLAAYRRGAVRAGSRVRMAATLPESVRQALHHSGLLALFDLPEAA
jgi:anti-anti-sigma factor